MAVDGDSRSAKLLESLEGQLQVGHGEGTSSPRGHQNLRSEPQAQPTQHVDFPHGNIRSTLGCDVGCRALLAEDHLAEKAVSAFAAQLAKDLYADLRQAAIASIKLGATVIGREIRPRFNSLDQLQQAIKNREVTDGQLVSVQCKMSRFGPFLRRHFLTFTVGDNTGLRKGPAIGLPNPVLGLFAQISSHWSPVGLLPMPSESVMQVTLLPENAPCLGVVSTIPLPGIGNAVPTMPALIPERFNQLLNCSCTLTGVLRVVPDSALLKMGMTSEQVEVARQQFNDIWLIDATQDAGDCRLFQQPSDNDELWGGLYASGHLEIQDGEAKYNHIIDPIVSAMSNAGLSPKVSQNLAGTKEFMIFAEGCRAVVGTRAPIFSIHMDAELSRNYANSLNTFDKISREATNGIAKCLADNGVTLANPGDLDFSYSDSETALTVLQSKAASRLDSADICAIRDWHRTRCKN